MAFSGSGAASGAATGAQLGMVGGPIGAGIGGVVGGLAGGFLGGGSDISKIKKKLNKNLTAQGVTDQVGYLGQQRYLQQILDETNSRYNSAFQDVNRAENAGNEQIALNSQAALQAAQGRAAQMGLNGGSAGSNLALASARDARMDSTRFQLELARQRSGLRIAQGASRANALGALGQFEAYKAQGKNALADKWYNFIAAKGRNLQGGGSVEYGQQSPDLSGLGALIGMFRRSDSPATNSYGFSGGGSPSLSNLQPQQPGHGVLL